MSLVGAVVPAAGLGTRLRPLTDATPKELLPLGAQPAIYGVLLEAAAAQLPRVVFVLGPHKAALRDWIVGQAGQWPFDVRLAEQPAPRGVLDAVARGRALLDPGPFAVLYPDFVHLPDQTALAQLAAAFDGEGALFGLYAPEGADPRRGATAAAALDGDPRAMAAPIARLSAGEGAPVAWRTTFAELRGPAWDRARALEPGEDDDALNLPTYNRLADAGLLRGLAIAGEVLDLGVRPGYDDARERFATDRARWRSPQGG